MKANSKMSMFRKTLLSYMLVLLIPMSVFFFVWQYQHTREVVNEMKIHYNSGVDDIVTAVDRKLQEVNYISERLAFSGWVLRAQSNSPIISDVFDIFRKKEIMQEISVYQATIGIADTVSVVFPERNIAICSYFWNDFSSLFFRIGIQDENDRENIKTLIRETDTQAFINLKQAGITNAKVNDCIFVRSISNIYNPKATLFLYLTQNSLDPYIKKINADGLLSFSIVQNDVPIYSSTYHKADKSQYNLQTLFPSGIFYWSYRIDLQQLDIRSISDRWYFSVMAFISLLIFSAFVAYLLARLSYQPIQRFVLNLMGTNQTKYEFVMIEQALNRFAKEKSGLENRIQQFIVTSRNNMLIDLLYGNFNYNQTRDNLIRCNINFTNDLYFQVILISEMLSDKGNLAESIGVVFLVKEYMQTILPVEYSSEYLELNNGDLVILMGCDDIPDPDETKNMVVLIQSFIDEHINSQHIVFSGIPQKGLIGISKSYQEAKVEKSSIIYNDYVGDIGFYYPLDWEIQMINNIKIGNWKIVSTILDELKIENQKRNLSPHATQRVASLILETLLRIVNDLGITMDNDVQNIFKSSHMLDEKNVWKILIYTANQICERIYSLSNIAANQLGRRLTKYVEDNYCRSSLSLQDLSDEYKLSVSRLSRIFKNTSNINFLDYLTLIRIEKAKEHFQNGEINIADVGKKVGYENEITFKRSFLRQEGTTPRKYLQVRMNNK